ncbi:hypothetical protein VKT23_013974 [Stygiomarasmius scandens]|uniref:Beta-xylanase n=1 Tax=Marasmiellus scandens TaxID=2682957 RepID=A0ABR1J4G9_9AGAR
MFKLLSFCLLAILAEHINAQSPVWGQCGGIGWSGPTTCASGSSCVASNAYYSQCIPGSSGGGSTGGGSTGGGSTGGGSTGGGSGGSTGTSSSGSLNAKFVSHGKKFWASAADQGTINIASNQALLKSDFGGVTPENSMKWDATEPNRGQFNFGGSDFLVNWAVTNGKLIRGHTLVWHSQLPSWVSQINDKNTLTSVIQTHISNVAGRYKGKLYAVMGCLQQTQNRSEILNEDGSLRSSVFSNVLGQQFVTIAFQAARQADSTAKLYINDYNLDSNNAKVQGMVRVVNSVNSGGKLIDGIGTQTHLGAGGAGGVQAAITALAATGCEIAITELDIAGASPNDYETVAKACLNTPACVSVTSWGVSDVNSWRSGDKPLLFDTNYQPKSAYSGLLSIM